MTTATWFLTEDGLYEILMQSRKTIAKEFKKEVKRSNALKSINLLNKRPYMYHLFSNVCFN
ncbi:BRO family protein [Bacillus paramycoides]|uniref:BRO family protein n=1 Tax=Bacillus paramycoides TaxID=2026194 RepID=UPI001FCFD377|nr:BRO family protein [Bacillus paramycoides]